MSSRLGCFTALAAAALLAFAGCTACAKGDTPVPELAGFTRERAEVTLRQSGLRLGDIRYDEDAKGAQGIIIAQSPEPGDTTVNNGRVDVVIAGPDLVRLPRLVGMDEREARTAISEADLRVGRVLRDYSDRWPEGIVIAMDPEGVSWAPRRSRIGITVSRGPENANVPGVSGMWGDQAEEFIYSIGFDAEMHEEYGRLAKGLVMEQDPPPGTRQRLGEDVDITVSKGSPPVEVPDVEGMALAEAVATVRAAGLVAIEERIRLRDFEGAGPVIGEQWPRAGHDVPEGSGVRLVVWSD